MATRFAARKVLVLATEDDCTGRSNSNNIEGIDGSIHAYCAKIRFSTECFEDVELLWEMPFQNQDLVDERLSPYLVFYVYDSSLPGK